MHRGFNPSSFPIAPCHSAGSDIGTPLNHGAFFGTAFGMAALADCKAIHLIPGGFIKQQCVLSRHFS